MNLKKIFNAKIIIALILLIAAGLGAAFLLNRKSGRVDYKTYEVRTRELRSVISATGTLKATETVDVGTQISGKIAELYVDYNSVVKKGDLIAKIDSSTQVTDLMSAQAEVQNSLAQLEKAEKDYKRTKELADQDLIAKTELDSAVSSYKTAKAGLAVSKAKASKAKITLSYTDIFAPVDGVVISKNVEVGQTVAASYSTPTIAEIARDLTKMQVEINVDEADIGNVKNGQTAEFTVDSFPDRTYYGKVVQIRLSPTTTDNVVTYTVVAEVSNEDKSLLPGMSANVSLILTEVKEALVVPNSAFRFKPIDKDKKSQTPGGGPGQPMKANIAVVKEPTVYLLKNGNAVERKVKKGISDGERTQILSGLSEGDIVITGVNLKKEGAK